MSPDVARAIVDLRARGVLSEGVSPPLLRVARGERVSVFHELRLLLFAGVTLVVAGVGFLVGENLERIGPLAIAIGIGSSAAVCLAWAFQQGLPFSWERVSSPRVAFDYVLLLGVLLASADVAYVEARFTPLGANWPWHLLLVSLAMATAAVRFDSRVVFSLALSTFASWRGVSVSFLESGFWSGVATATRLNALGCGLLFARLGFLLVRGNRKAHFEPVATYLGWSLVLGSLASGALTEDDSWSRWAFLLLLVSAALSLHSFRRRRFPLFAMGAIGAYVAFSRFIVPVLDREDTLLFLWFLLSSTAMLFGLLRAHRTLGKSS